MSFYEAMDSQIGSLFEDSAGRVQYRSHGTTRTLSAMRAGTSWHDIESVKSVRLLSSSRDYIFRASDFASAKPCPKDEITDGTEVWTVYDLAGEECWRPLGVSTSFIRIHCRK